MRLRASLLFVALACSSSPPVAQAPVVRFITGAAVPNFMDVPFPSDAYLRERAHREHPGDRRDRAARTRAMLLARALRARRVRAHDVHARSTSTIRPRPRTTTAASRPRKIDTSTLPPTEAACAGGRELGLSHRPRHADAHPVPRRVPRRADSGTRARCSASRPRAASSCRRAITSPRSSRRSSETRTASRSPRARASSGWPTNGNRNDVVTQLYGVGARQGRGFARRRARRCERGGRGVEDRRARRLHDAHDGRGALRPPRSARGRARADARVGRDRDGADGRREVHEHDAAAGGLHREPRRLARRPRPRRSSPTAPTIRTASSPCARTTRSTRSAPRCSTRRTT